MLKDNIEIIVERHKKLYSGTSGALVYINSVKTASSVPTPKVGKYSFPLEYKTYIKDCFDAFINNFKNKENLDDDMIPYFRPKLGIQEHSSFISGNNECKVDFVGETSFHHQMVYEKEDLESLYLSEENKYYQLLKNCYEYLNEISKDICHVALRGTNLALDIANTIRGNDLLYDFYDDPEWLEKLLSFCNDAAIWYTNKQLQWVKPVYGGYITGFGKWMEGTCVGHLAEDGTCLIGPELYEEFCLKYTDAFLNNFDGAYMHTHSVADSSLKLVIQNPKIKIVEISSDPNSYTSIEVFKMYEDILKDKVVNLECSFDELKNNIEFLRDKRIILDFNCNSLEEAKEIVSFVRKELPIK